MAGPTWMVKMELLGWGSRAAKAVNDLERHGWDRMTVLVHGLPIAEKDRLHWLAMGNYTPHGKWVNRFLTIVTCPTVVALTG
ncbi:unnamed protein product, partial [Symbiodinium sp. CCMP2592]